MFLLKQELSVEVADINGVQVNLQKKNKTEQIVSENPDITMNPPSILKTP